MNVLKPIWLVEDSADDIELTLAALDDVNLANRVIVMHDGSEVIERLQANDRPDSLPVVMLTSSRQGPDLAECYRLGANGYVVKPMESAAFFEAVKTTGTFWAMVNERPPVSKVSEVGDADPARK